MKKINNIKRARREERSKHLKRQVKDGDASCFLYAALDILSTKPLVITSTILWE
jgi:hypothetical protein